MIYLGDYQEDSVVNFAWTTNDKNGAAINRSTKGTIKVYIDDDPDSGTTMGVTDTDALDGVVGINQCRVDLSAGSDYAKGHDYQVVLSGAVIDGESVNAVLAMFSIENRFGGSALFAKAAKVLCNKAVQNKVTGEIDYYDDDGQAIILTHTPVDEEGTLTRVVS